MNFSPSLVQSGMRGRMAMKGMRGLGQFDVGEGVDTSSPYPGQGTTNSSPVTSTTAPVTSGVVTTQPGATGGFDWASTLQTGIKAAAAIFGTVTQASVQKQAIDAQKQVATAQAGAAPSYGSYLNPSYIYGQAQQMPMTIPIVVGVALLGFFLLKR
jgi:hypothetical protein